MTVFSLFSPGAFANPVGGSVASGAATIASSGNTLSVNQTTDKALIDWRSFDIAPNETTKFIQPGTSSLTVNRINDSKASSIFGTLSANGNLILLNQNGILFGQGSKVDVGGLLATTNKIDDAQFKNGKLAFGPSGAAPAQIINNGTITAKVAGLVGLVAPQVANNGTISAKLGKVELSSGDSYTLDLAGDGLIGIKVTGDIGQQIVSNAGMIEANGGRVDLTAAAARGLVNSLVSDSGVIQAESVGNKTGTVRLYAEGANAVQGNVSANKGKKSGTSTVTATGQIDTRGTKSGEKGGQIELLADNVGVMQGAILDASGQAGGGTVRIGGDFHGAGGTPDAMNTKVQKGTLIYASSTNVGKGGDVAVWSDKNTLFAGSIFAEGGPNGGDGGYVETSGRQYLSLADLSGNRGFVNASAPKGLGGTWLLDPEDVTISTGADSDETGNPNFVPGGTQATSVINTTDISTALNAGTNVKITTSNNGQAGPNGGSITVANSISATGAGTNLNTTGSLTLSSFKDIIINANANITLGGGTNISSATVAGGSVTLDSANSGNNIGAIVMNNSAGIYSHGGDIVIGGGLDATSNPAVGDASYTNGVGLLAHNTLDASGGNISIRGTGNNNNGVYLTGTNPIIKTINGGTINITGTALGTGGYGFYQAASSSLVQTQNGDLNITGYGSISSTSNGNGVAITGGTVKTTGSGTMTVQGTGAGTGNADLGIYLVGNALQATGSGNIVVIGTGSQTAGTGNTNAGVVLAPGSITGNGGNISITGTGGVGTGGSNYGIWFHNAGSSAISSSGPALISMTGIGGNGSGSTGILADAVNTVTAGGVSQTGKISFITDSLSFGTTPTIQTTGNVTYKPNNASTSINVATGASGLQITSSLLGATNAGSLTIGDVSDTGTMNIGPYSNWSIPVSFVSGNSGAIIVSGAQTNTSTFSFTGPTTLSANLTEAGITFNSAVSLGANSIINSGAGTATFSSTIDGAQNLTATAGSFSFGNPIGGATPLSAVSLTSTSGLTLPSISSTSIFAQTTGATADLTIPVGKTLTATGAGTPITLASGRNFINNAGSSALSAASGRWLVYSTNPANDTTGSLANNFRLFTCAYAGSCPSLGSGNGFLYSYTPQLTATPDAISITYGQTPSYTYSLSGYLGSDSGTDTITGSASFSTNATTSVTSGKLNAGTWNITDTIGSLASSMGYSITGATRNNGLTIGQKAITVTAATNTKQYDGTTSAAALGSITTGSLAAGDSATWTEVYNNKNAGAGNKTLTASGDTVTDGNSGNNYSITFVDNNTGTITAKALSILGVTAGNKVYDALVAAALNTAGDSLSGVLGGDTVNLSNAGATGTFADKNVGNGKAVTTSGFTISGADAGNYSLTQPTTTANITARPITVTAATNTKQYDGTTSAAALGSITTGSLAAGDSATWTEVYNNKNVGAGNKTLTASGDTVTDGNSGNNYSVTFVDNTNGTITARPITVTAATNTKTYDGNTSAAATPTITVGSVVAGDTANFTESYSTKTAGNGKTLTPSGSVTDGNSGSNYAVTFANDNTGVINQKGLTVLGVTAGNKVYDALVAAALNTAGDSLSGVLGGDTVNLSNAGATGTFADKNVGNGKAVTTSGFTISGADAGNYSLTQPTTTANITPAHLTVTADDQHATQGGSMPPLTATLTGFVGGEDLASSGVAGAADLSTVGTTGSAVGSYPIVASLGTLTATNYDFPTFANGLFTLAAAASSGGGRPPIVTPPVVTPPAPTPAPIPTPVPPAPAVLVLPESVVQAVNAPVIVPLANTGSVAKAALRTAPTEIVINSTDVIQTQDLAPEVGTKTSAKPNADCVNSSGRHDTKCHSTE